MNLRNLSAFMIVAGLTGSAFGANIYVTTSGNYSIDTAAVVAMNLAGHTAFVGVAHTQFDSNVDLTGFNAVYLQPNSNWGTGDMPWDGQVALLNYVANGGGLITCEWTGWSMSAGQLQLLVQAMPFVPITAFTYNLTETFERVTSDSILDQGVAASFVTDLDSYGGTESNFTTLRPGAKNFYAITSQGPNIGLAGWGFGAGKVISFGTTNGPSQIAGACQTLFGNSVTWATTGSKVVADWVSTVQGEEFVGDGSSVSVFGDDNSYAAFNDVDTLGCTILVRSQIGPIPSKLHFGWTTRVGRPGLALQVAMFDYIGGGYRMVWGGVAPTAFETGGADSPLAAARFRNGSGIMQSRFIWSPVNDEDPSQDGWLHEIDLAAWSYQ